MSRNRNRTILLILGLVIASAAVGWLAGSTIQSPEEAAARTAPPQPSPILVPVEERLLTADVVTRGTARFGLPQTISVSPSALKAEAGLITMLPIRGTQLQEGAVLLTASGRPLFLLEGSAPAYRDFVPGISGNDVRQLEEALARLGYDVGAVDGVYDEATATAVAAWVGAAGFEPFAATAEELANIRAIEQELAVAQNEQLSADEAAAAAPLAVEAARAEANAANKAAVAEVATSPRSTLEIAQAAALATQLAGEAAVQAALNEQAAATREAERAADLVAQLTAALELAQHNAGVKLPLDEIVFVPDLPVRIDQLDVAVGDSASGPLLIVTNNQVAIDASLPLDEAPLVKPGMVVNIDEPTLGVKATGTVSRIAATPGTDGVDGFHVYFEVLVDETTAALDGFSLRLTIPVESTGGLVMAVPISALSLAADGRSRIQVDNEGVLEFITVEPGLAADGYVAVTPIEGQLQAGQLVVIGFEAP